MYTARGGGGRGFFWGISNYLERDKGSLPKLLTDEGGGGGELTFSLLIEERKHFFCGFFL